MRCGDINEVLGSAVNHTSPLSCPCPSHWLVDPYFDPQRCLYVFIHRMGICKWYVIIFITSAGLQKFESVLVRI